MGDRETATWGSRWAGEKRGKERPASELKRGEKEIEIWKWNRDTERDA